jgi:hypothetical protein
LNPGAVIDIFGSDSASIEMGRKSFFATFDEKLTIGDVWSAIITKFHDLLNELKIMTHSDRCDIDEEWLYRRFVNDEGIPVREFSACEYCVLGHGETQANSLSVKGKSTMSHILSQYRPYGDQHLWICRPE